MIFQQDDAGFVWALASQVVCCVLNAYIVQYLNALCDVNRCVLVDCALCGVFFCRTGCSRLIVTQPVYCADVMHVRPFLARERLGHEADALSYTAPCRKVGPGRGSCVCVGHLTTAAIDSCTVQTMRKVQSCSPISLCRLSPTLSHCTQSAVSWVASRASSAKRRYETISYAIWTSESRRCALLFFVGMFGSMHNDDGD